MIYSSGGGVLGPFTGGGGVSGMPVAPTTGYWLAQGDTWNNVVNVKSSPTFQYSSDTTATQPAPGVIKFNSTDLSLVTEAYFSKDTFVGVSIAPLVAEFVQQDQIIVGQIGAPNNLIELELTEIPSDNGTWYTAPVRVLQSVGGLTDGVALDLNYQPLAGRARSEVVVRSDDDLPPLDGGFSVLRAETQYTFQNGISLSKPLLVNQPGVSLAGTSPFAFGVMYTGTGSWLTVDNVSTSIHNLPIKSVTATQFIDAVGTGANTFYTQGFNMQGAVKLGTFNGISPVFNNFVAVGFTDGFTYSSAASTIRGLSFVNAFMLDDFSGTSVHFDLDDAVFGDLEIQNVIMDGTGTCLSSSVGGSANIVSGVEGDVIGTTFGQSGFMTPLSGFTDDFQTNQWGFSDNSPIDTVESSRYFVDQYLVTQNTIAVASANTFYDIGAPLSGAWASDVSAHFQPNTDGSVTYTGDRVIAAEVIATTTLEQSGGGQDFLEARIAINWTPGDTGIEKSKAGTQNSQPTTVPMTAAVTLNPNDNIRLIYANRSDASDIIVDLAKIEIGGR